MATCPECGRRTSWLSDIHAECANERARRALAASEPVYDPVGELMRGHWVPVGLAPRLHTVNGYGTRLIGRQNVDQATGVYESTLYFVFAFLPIFPLSRYRVRLVDPVTYSFLAEGPLTRGDWLRLLWGWGLVIAVVAAFFTV